MIFVTQKILFMHIYKIALFLSLTSTWLVGYGQEEAGRTLVECIEIAIQNNAKVHQSQLQVKRSQVGYRQAWQNQLPNLQANLSHGLNQGKNIDPTTNQFIEETISAGNQSLTTDITVFNGFKIFHDIRMRSSALEAGKLEYEGQLNELKLDVIEAYIKVLTARDMLKQAELQYEVTEEQLRRADVMHKEGAFPPGDYYDIKGQASSDLNTIESMKQTLYSSRVYLAGLLYITENELGEISEVSLPTDAVEEDADKLYAIARDTLAIYKSWSWRVREAELAIKVAKSSYFPSLYLGAGLNSRYSNSNDKSYMTQTKNNLGKYISLNLQIPIFSRFTTRNQVENARINLKDVQWQEEQALNILKQNTAKAVFDLRSSRESIKNLEAQERSYSESFRVAEVQFDLGASNSVMYLTAKNKLDNTRNQLLIKKYEWILQKYINDYYSGKLN